jgi:ribosomal protein S18 acetylase RimI-like enzyme
MTVRRLSVGDESSAEEAVRLFADESPLPIDTSSFLRRPEAVLFVSTDDGDGSLAGWVYGHELVHPDGERTMLLYALDVADGFQRRGHGRALVSAFVDHARSSGCTEVWVLTDDDNVAAVATYSAAGGVREPDDSVMFVWPLAPGREAGAERQG